MAPTFGVRVAGSPVEDLKALQFPATGGVVDEHVELTGWLRTEGDALSDLLHTVIGQCEDGGIKPLLVALRRTVFQAKTPGDRVWSSGVRRVLPADLTARIGVWVSLLHRAKALEARLPEVLAAEKSTVTGVLRETVATSAFRFALVLGSPTLAAALSEWIDDPSAEPPRWPVLLRLAKYLSRAAAKTSPYASFTFSGLGTWARSGPASNPAGELAWRGIVELDRQAVMWIWSGLARRPELRDHIRLRVNPSAIEADGQLRFLGAAVGEPVLSVGVTETLRCVLDFVRTMPQPTLGGLLKHLEGTGAQAEPERCTSYIDRLVGLGLLELCRPFPDQGSDPLDDLAHWVVPAADASVAATGWQQALWELRAVVRDYPELADARDRARTLHHIRGTLADLLTELGQPHSPALPRHDAIKENAVIAHPVLTCSRGQWQPVFDDLGVLRRFLGVFNPHLTATVRATAFFLDQFGPDATVPLLEFYRGFHAVRPLAKGPYAHSRGLAVSGPPPGRELVGLRRAALDALYSGAEDASGIVHVDPRVLIEIAASWPPSIRAPSSICCYGQALPGPNGPRLVLNTVRTGYGWGISRIHHLITQAGEQPPAPWQPSTAMGDASVVLAECRAAFATNLSLRPAAVPYEIDYPRAESDTAAATRISMAELQVSYNPGHGRVILRGPGGAEVRPLALGMLAEHALPPALRFMIRVFGEPQTALAPDRQLGHTGLPTAADGVRRRPRLEMARIVLARAAWSLHVKLLPLRNKGESDAAQLLRFARWRKQHGIPRRCFVRVLTPVGNAGQNRLLGKARKPLYLDFSNWLLLTAFERTITHFEGLDAVVVFEEALPALADAPCYGEHGQRVTEYIFELSAATADD